MALEWYSKKPKLPPRAPVAKPVPMRTAAGSPATAAPAAPAPVAPVPPPGLTPDEQFYFDANNRRILDQYGLSTNQLVFQQQQAQLNRALAEGQLNDKFALMRRNLSDPYAARGLLNSGIHAQGITDEAQAEQSALDALRRQYEEQFGGLGLQQYQLDYTKKTAQEDLEAQRRARLNTIASSIGGR